MAKDLTGKGFCGVFREKIIGKIFKKPFSNDYIGVPDNPSLQPVTIPFSEIREIPDADIHEEPVLLDGERTVHGDVVYEYGDGRMHKIGLSWQGTTDTIEEVLEKRAKRRTKKTKRKVDWQ